jgi:sulfite exporter TauE/SafE
VTGLHLLSAFMIGLLGSPHCIGMCGGIVGAFSAAGGRRPFPVAVVAVPRQALARGATIDEATRVVGYNFGRLASYATAGAIAGGLAHGVQTLSLLSSLQIGGYWLANLMLVALGLYLMDAWRGLARLEAVGQLLWRRLQPLMRHLLPVDSFAKALSLGALWGWVPCGMVYSVLLSALATGSAGGGAAVMLAFGAGTLPALFTAGMLGARFQAWTRQRGVRIAAGLIVLGFGLLGLVRAANGVSLGWLDALCLTPPASQAQD